MARRSKVRDKGTLSWYLNAGCNLREIVMCDDLAIFEIPNQNRSFDECMGNWQFKISIGQCLGSYPHIP